MVESSSSLRGEQFIRLLRDRFDSQEEIDLRHYRQTPLRCLQPHLLYTFPVPCVQSLRRRIYDAAHRSFWYFRSFRARLAALRALPTNSRSDTNSMGIPSPIHRGRTALSSLGVSVSTLILESEDSVRPDMCTSMVRELLVIVPREGQLVYFS